MWDKSKKLPNLCSKIAPASPGVSDKKSTAPGGLGASIPRPRPRSRGGPPGFETLVIVDTILYIKRHNQFGVSI